MSDITKVCIVDNVFTQNECNSIINYGLQGINYALNNNITISEPTFHNYKTVVLPTNEFTNSLHQRICNYTYNLNMEHWKFDLTNFTENYIGLFETSSNAFCKPYLKLKNGINQTNNKLNILLALTEQTAYKGNELLVQNFEGQINFKQGSIVVFPAYLSFTFQAIIEGNNYILLTSVQGPSFK